MSKAIHTADGESEGVNPACHKLYDVVQLSTYELKGSENITLRTVIATTPVDMASRTHRTRIGGYDEIMYTSCVLGEAESGDAHKVAGDRGQRMARKQKSKKQWETNEPCSAANTDGCGCLYFGIRDQGNLGTSERKKEKKTLTYVDDRSANLALNAAYPVGGLVQVPP
ncbi:hypothetical protein V2G26_013830 [Clonostachys chloroleuca]